MVQRRSSQIDGSVRTISERLPCLFHHSVSDKIVSEIIVEIGLAQALNNDRNQHIFV